MKYRSNQFKIGIKNDQILCGTKIITKHPHQNKDTDWSYLQNAIRS